MKRVYPVFFTTTDNNVLVDAPDLGVLTEGKDLYDAIIMARDAIQLMCITLEDEGMIPPAPTDFITMFQKGSTFAEEGKTILSLVDIDTDSYRKMIEVK